MNIKTACVSAALVLALSTATSAVETNFVNGWCFKGDGCTGPIPLSPEGFGLCEESCSMSNPVPVRDMEGFLFDVSCRGDLLNFDYRMFLLQTTGDEDKKGMISVTSRGSEVLERC